MEVTISSNKENMGAAISTRVEKMEAVIWAGQEEMKATISEQVNSILASVDQQIQSLCEALDAQIQGTQLDMKAMRAVLNFLASNVLAGNLNIKIYCCFMWVQKFGLSL
jgi:hypothetical protein